MGKYTINQFRAQFKDEDTCLHYLFTQRFGELTGCPGCAVESKFSRVKGRRCYQCPECSYQIYPTAGTVFHQSTTPLTHWFYAIYLFTTTRNGVAAKELERQLSVCYKTALRMAHQIKKLMTEDGPELLTGEVMIDETYLGMQSKNRHASDRKKLNVKRGPSQKVGVMVMIQKSGAIRTKVLGVDTPAGQPLAKIIMENVSPTATVVTDSHFGYRYLKRSFKKHVSIDHSSGQYVKKGFSTNRNENYNSTLKRMIKGTHIHVSAKHLPKYVAENTFRYVNRDQPELMFHKILFNVK